jgi:hypothetical protein
MLFDRKEPKEALQIAEVERARVAALAAQWTKATTNPAA